MMRNEIDAARGHLPGFVRNGVLLLVLVTLAAGCRTYGGYGTEVKTVTAIEAANEQFARSLARAEADLVALRAAAETKPVLTEVVNRYERVVFDQTQLLKSHQDDLARLTAGLSGYRTSSRLLGSIVTDHHRISNRYRTVIARAAEFSGFLPAAIRARALYQQVPPYFVRLEFRLTQPELGHILRSGV